MPRVNNPVNSPMVGELVSMLVAVGDGAPTLEQKRQLLRDLREQSPESAQMAEGEILKSVERMHFGLEQARELTDTLRSKIDDLVGKLWHPAIFLGLFGDPEERRARVLFSKSERVVGVWENVPTETLCKGCEVMLNHELSAVVAVSTTWRAAGDIGTVVEKTVRGSLILRSREEDVEVEMAAPLAKVELKAGDRVRWEQSGYIAFEKVEQLGQKNYQLGEAPNVPLDAVGGQDDNLRKLLDILTVGLVDPVRAAAYGLRGGSVLLVGPPGCGKTLMVKAALSAAAKAAGKKAKLFVAKPSEWESSLVGATEKNIRELFVSLRAAAKDGSLVVLFIDECDAIGRIRGQIQGFYSDKALNALLAEIDGFHGRGESVALIAATNRKDNIDAALLQRLSDHEIEVRPPDMMGAKAIFGIHLRPSYPYNPNGTSAIATRKGLIEKAVSLIYSPNSPYSELCRIKFRDGKSRIVAARDFACGRLIEQICRDACMRAYQLEQRTGEAGLKTMDIEEALASAMERLASTVTVHNARNQLMDLPTDVDVVSVDRILRKVSRPHRYLAQDVKPADDGANQSEDRR